MIDVVTIQELINCTCMYYTVFLYVASGKEFGLMDIEIFTNGFNGTNCSDISTNNPKISVLLS